MVYFNKRAELTLNLMKVGEAISESLDMLFFIESLISSIFLVICRRRWKVREGEKTKGYLTYLGFRKVQDHALISFGRV